MAKPNIVVIMSDDVGIWNIGAYHRGMMAGRTPHLDKLAAEGMLFTDYYGEARCTAGRSAFVTGQLPIRTGSDHRRPGWRRCRYAGLRAHDRYRPQGSGLRDRPVWEEPSRRLEQVPAYCPRVR